MRFREEPYEWVYEGLKPLLLSDVARSRRGMSLSLAVLCCAVARRLGVPLALVRAPEQGAQPLLPGSGE